jgi:hypothetical protein
MNGLIKVTPESLISLIEYCMDYMSDFNIANQPKIKRECWSWSKFRFIEEFGYKAPCWYGYKKSLTRHFHELHDMALNTIKYGDEIWLSELSYKNMVLLKNGNEDANPIYIMNY